MPRVQLLMPEGHYFSTTIPVRITDLNYGGHVGNDTILSLIHEARVQYLNQWAYNELNFAGVSLIMSDVAIEFKAELFYGTLLNAHVAAAHFSRVGFELYYKLTTETKGKETVIALAKTGMVCFNYETKKVAALPSEALNQLIAR